MNRRRFLFSAAAGGAVLAGTGAIAPVAAAATDDELAFANFGAATELLLSDYYGRLVEANLFEGSRKTFVRSRSVSNQHAAALSKLLDDAGTPGPVADDFEFVWTEDTFETAGAAATAGLTIVEALLGAYLRAAATLPTESYRVLFSSLAASLGEERSALALASGRPAVTPFPIAVDLEAASAAVEAFLG